MEKKVYSAKTIEEAKKLAIDELDEKEENLIFIEKEEKKSLFSKKVEIEVIKKDDVIKFIKEFLKNIVNDMGLDANIEYKTREETEWFNIITSNNPILIGKNGRTIDAIQTILNQVLNKEIEAYFRVQIDVGDYKIKKQGRLEKLAKYTAKDVAMSKCEVKLEPMNAYERRIIHNILTNSKDVKTESVGEEPNRCVVIKPKEE